MKSFFILLLFGSLLHVNRSFGQSQSYQLSGTYSFDYEVVQVLVSKRSTTDTSFMHFFYTKSGDYAAARMNRKAKMRDSLFIILTRDGTCVMINEHHKNITIISIRKLMSDLSGLTKWIRMDSLVASMRKKTDGRDFKTAKTGNNAQVGSYTSEEYSVSENGNHKGSVWCARVDFNSPGDYLLGAVGGNFLKMMNGPRTDRPLFQALMQPKTLVTDIDMLDSTGGHRMNMHTVSIKQTPTTISTSGYTVSNYSNMTVPEIFQAEMKKRHD
jgi:hypothetical protein